MVLPTNKTIVWALDYKLPKHMLVDDDGKVPKIVIQRLSYFLRKTKRVVLYFLKLLVEVRCLEEIAEKSDRRQFFSGRAQTLWW